MAKENLSEYERQRLKNIQENEAMLKKLFPDGPGLFEQRSQPKPKILRPRKTESISRALYPTRSNPPRKAKKSAIPMHSVELDEQEAEEDDEDMAKCGTAKLIVKFPFAFVKRRKGSTSDSDEEVISPKKKRKVQQHFEDILEEDLVLVANRFGDKNYDSVNGTSCHQCRQKTDDLKTRCYGSECVGVRGQFCGPCLRIRYGEDAKEALMNRQWVCPPCRGICNCSFCMKKRGRKCTGILAHIANEHGYKSVKELLGD